MNNEEYHPLEKHPFTQIQLSDREKFHTGMLKLTLDVFQKDAYAAIFGVDFANDLYTADKKIKTCLEENSVDLVIKKLPKNEKGKSNGEVFAIIESKFKTGLHYSNYKGEKISQLEKYALNNPKTEHGFVVSLFPEEEEDLKIQSKQKAKIHEFKKIRFTKEVLDYLKKTYSNYEKTKDEDEMEFWKKIQKDPATPLITLWKSYLEGLEEILNLFEKNNNPLDRITFKEEKEDIKSCLSNIKLKGVFEGFRMNQVKTKLEEELKKDDEIIKTLQDGANVWGKPDAENNFIILGNTHGNASMSLVMFDERESITYGIQWQAGIVKVFIQPEGKLVSDWKNDKKKLDEENKKRDKKSEKTPTLGWLAKREKALNDLKDEVCKEIETTEVKLNKEGKFRSFTLFKRDVLIDDLRDMPKKVLKILKILSKHPLNI